MIIQAPRSDAAMTYPEALMYCFFLEHRSQAGWRLPTAADVNNIQRFRDYGFQYNAWRVNHPAAGDEDTYMFVYPVKDV